MMLLLRSKWWPPIWISIVTFVGLVGALVVEGPVGDIAGAVGLGAPLLVTAWFLRRA
ncbi:hypothetical protein J2D73_12960 [Acetobacter sacchari]|uniref:Uncharacterized protein n=1 Tax=Acetobacter sacchari TaxID=2661687 RepID=A0ABS3LXP9_9PROT|nr:hypothetical protein [Acetobacter sacchari]MBO1360697.1 hypothetical protein [Acetobacter sacchari]